MMIDENNYEDYLLDYVDGELTPAGEEALLKYIARHPALREELRLLQRTRPDKGAPAPFPDKALLYRSGKETTRKRRPFIYRKRIQIAASIAACLIFSFWLYPGHQKEESAPAARVAVVKKKQPDVRSTPPGIVPPRKDKETASKASKPNLPDELTNARAGKQRYAASGPQETRKQSAPQDNRPTFPSLQKITVAPLQPESPPMAMAAVDGTPIPERAPLSAEKGKAVFPSHSQQVGSGSLQRLKAHKEALDSSFTDKVFALHDKLSHPLKALNIKEVRIGGLSIVFN